MKTLHYTGHAGFTVETDVHRLVFDPWIKDNPIADPSAMDTLVGADYVFVTHDHSDHGFDEAVETCLADENTVFVGIHEIGLEASGRGVKNVVRGNLGGSILLDEEMEVFFAIAFHSCRCGVPCGFVVKTPELTVYHAGDTAFYSDMEYLGKRYDIDLALLPIGSTYTMGPREAAWAVARLKPGVVVPMHYNTFDVIKQDPEEFRRLVGDMARVEVLKPGATLEL